MYPYNLAENPYPCSPTPTVSDARILGGEKHHEAKAAILSCIQDLYSKISLTATDNDFRLITVIQDVGSGKTHLTLHIRGLKEVANNGIISYIDLSQISPRDIHSLYRSILQGFTDEYVTDFRKSVVYFLKHKAEQNIKDAKKVFNYGFLDLIKGKSLANKTEEILQNKTIPNYSAIHTVLKEDFSPIEISILKLIIEGKFKRDLYDIATREDMIASLSAIANLNLKFLKKITIFQMDEFDSDKESLDFVKAVINAHLPSAVLMLILTPSSYDQIRIQNSSVFDRLEKANYKIDLAGSNTLEEIVDIILEYVRYNDYEKKFTIQDQNDLAAKIRIIYDEFPDFRNIRSTINILYNAMENAEKKGAKIINEDDIDSAIKNLYPGLRVKGSIMDVPLSDFIKIRRNSSNVENLEADLRDAVRNLVSYAYGKGTVASLEVEDTNGKDNNGIDVIYNDPAGNKVAVAVMINRDYVKNFDQISETVKSQRYADKLLILTNANITSIRNGTSVVSMDRHKMIDLIYFNSKYRNNDTIFDDHDDENRLQRALILAKSIKLC